MLPPPNVNNWHFPLNPIKNDKVIHPPDNIDGPRSNDNKPFPKKDYGEAAVFKKGIIGNYEPPDIKVVGPGMKLFTIFVVV